MRLRSVTVGLVALASIAAWAAAGCLPGDTRPVPARVTMYASPTSASADGFTTGDGWQVDIDRIVTSVGSVDFEEETCTPYGEAHYRRLFDFGVATHERVGILHGMGTCGIEFRFDAPSDDSILGTGVTDADFLYMRTRGTDPYVIDERVALWVKGSATKDGVEKSFDWSFRSGYELTECVDTGDPSGETFVTTLELESEDAYELTIEIRAEELFRLQPEDDAPLHFEAFAVADERGNGDGAVTIEELADAPPPQRAPIVIPDDPDGGGNDDDDEIPVDTSTLGGLVYTVRLPRVARIAGGGACDHESRGGR